MAMKLWRVVVSVVLIGLIALEGFEFREIRRLRSEVDDLKWDLSVERLVGINDTIDLNVGVIQFLRRGYSIELESVKFNADGVSIAGYIGNPLNLAVSGLTIKFTATKQLYQAKEDFLKQSANDNIFFFGPPSIGDAQTTTISQLLPGTKRPFEVTIPNVKQTPEGVRIVVTFSGERYSY